MFSFEIMLILNKKNEKKGKIKKRGEGEFFLLPTFHTLRRKCTVQDREVSFFARPTL